MMLYHSSRKDSSPYYPQKDSTQASLSYESSNDYIMAEGNNIPSKEVSSGRRNISFEIDVKPKQRYFATKSEKLRFISEYKRKLKTELCKTFTLKGSCRFGAKCSFAHGIEELKAKVHISSNYKTRPCREFFMQGFCKYGYRCQYLHTEIQYDQEKIVQFYDFLVSSYNNKQISINFLSRNTYFHSIRLKRLENMLKNQENQAGFGLF